MIMALTYSMLQSKVVFGILLKGYGHTASNNLEEDVTMNVLLDNPKLSKFWLKIVLKMLQQSHWDWMLNLVFERLEMQLMLFKISDQSQVNDFKLDVVQIVKLSKQV